MGVRHLNRFLVENCKGKESIKAIHFRHLKNKTVAIDTSIFMYKFATENKLMENMYLLISILKLWSIRPLFIFDGKPPPEKKALIKKRKWEKHDAETKYNCLKSEIDSNVELSQKERKQAIEEMDELKKKFVRIRHDQIAEVKQLMSAYSVEYYDAPGESDQLCVYLVQKGHAYACMSDDMDMFLYGCERVIRGINVITQECTIYNTPSILADLSMTSKLFNEIIVISGTDYNIQENISLNETIRWYQQYKKTMDTYMAMPMHIRVSCSNVISQGFYHWLKKNTKYIEKIDSIEPVLDMFVLDMNDNLFDDITGQIEKNVFKPFIMNDLMKVMMPHGFVFVNQ